MDKMKKERNDNKKPKIWRITAISVMAVLLLLFFAGPKINYNPRYSPGDILDSLDGVYVYYNGGVGQVHERHLSEDGYNIGLKYQCVEFIKRYYLLHFGHKMPDPYGHAKDFFDPKLSDGTINTQRALTQYTNGSVSCPRKGDLIVFAPTVKNKYGHVAIISTVSESDVEIIQQNPGPKGPSRKNFPLECPDGKWTITNERVLGWLRIPEN